MTRQVILTVNETPIPVDYFVQEFIDHTVGGAIEALEGTGPIRDLLLDIDGENVAINLNGAHVATNKFASKLIRSTMAGMVSALKGVTDTRRISIRLMRGT